MKKIIFLFSFLPVISRVHGQSCEGVPLINENFDNGTIPGNWTILDLDGNTLSANSIARGWTGAWIPRNHYGRQCVGNLSHFVPAGAANDFLITPPVTLGSAPVCLSWKGSTMFSTYTETYEIRISTTTPDATGMSAYPSLAVINNDLPGWTEHSVDLSAFAGQTVYIGFWYTSNSQYELYLDDIHISQPVNVDASVKTLNFADVVPVIPQTISGTLLNGGLNTLTSFALNWKVNNGPVNSMNVSSVNIAPSSFYNFTHSITWTPPSPGTYSVKIWTSNPNGVPDQYSGNDTLTQVVFVNNFPRRTLVEEFTQASCPPCAIQNPAFDSLLQPNIYANKISSIKFHTLWPGFDPMNTFNPNDVMQRVSYYGVAGVPCGIVNGTFIPDDCQAYEGSPSCLTQQDVDNSISIPSIFDVQVSNSIIGNTMNISVSVTAKTDMPLSSFSLYTMVIEDTIDYGYSPGTNGETVFYQVMRKILPDSSGQPMQPMVNNQTLTFNYSYPIDASNEDPNWLRTVAVVQDDATRHVYQTENTSVHSTGMSENGNEYELNVFPNPAHDHVSVFAKGLPCSTVHWELLNVVGEKMIEGVFLVSNGSLSDHIDTGNLAAGIYFMKMQVEDHVIVKRMVKD